MEKNYILPAFTCPNMACKAKNILFAYNRVIRKRTKLVMIEDVTPNMCADFILICPKCKSRLALCDCSMVDVPLVIG